MSHACNSHLDRTPVGVRVRHVAGRALSALTLAALLLVAPPAGAAQVRWPVRVLVPEPGNLQLLAFWVALGAGYFAEEGIDVVPVSPASPALAQSAFTDGDAPAALLPAPVYERLIAEELPFVLVANLLANDPIDLVVLRATAEARGLAATAKLADRLRAMRGLRIGVGPHPRPRLAALFASEGLDVDAVAKVVVVRGDEQNEALASGRVDALYTHTPFLENAIVDEGAVVVARPSAGEVPALADRQIHALAVTRALLEADPRLVAGLVRAIARAERLVQRDAGATEDAVLRALPSRDRAHVSVLVSLYGPAVPASPEVSSRKITRELAFYPDGQSPPDLAGKDLERFVYADPDARARGNERSLSRTVSFLAGVVALLVALVAVLGERVNSRGARGPDTFV
jgi:NitT/TauT family transport system substrate-binding protein